MPTATHTETIRASARQVFAILDNVEVTPSWHERCTRMERLTPGPTVVGTRLGYHFKDGPRLGHMDGHVIGREVDRRLTHAFTDRFMDIEVDFRLDTGEGTGAGSAGPDAGDDASTRLTHTLTVNPKGIGRALTPFIRRGLARQVEASVAGLRRLAED